jgi:AraC-like DNA-binding protein
MIKRLLALITWRVGDGRDSACTSREVDLSSAEVRTKALSGWTDRIFDFGVSVPEALLIAGIGSPAFPCPQDMILLNSFARMAEFVGDRASAKNASWLIGEDYDLDALGEVGEAVLSARTLGGALRRLADNFEMLQDASCLKLDISIETTTISYRILDPSIWPRHQDALFSLGIISKILKLAVPEAMHFMELGFECRKRDTGLKVDQSQLEFECEANSIRIPSAMLDEAMPAFPRSCDLKRLSMNLADRRRQKPARDRLTGIIFARLSDGNINQEDLAGEIGMSSRTMRRRLANEATSFQQLLDDCRMRQAMLEFKSRPEASIADIALRLGYAEHSTFTRAFTRWSGSPPQKFRTDLNTTKH